MADINKIAEELGTLTILEAADLVKLPPALPPLLPKLKKRRPNSTSS